MVRHLALATLLALAPGYAAAQTCTSDPVTVVNEIYKQLLGRPANDGGEGVWQQQLREGRTVRDIVRDIAHSPEHMELVGPGTSSSSRRRAVQVLYRHLLDRRPDESGLSGHADDIGSKGIAYVIDDFVNSPEYTKNFGEWRVPGTNVEYCGNGLGLTRRARQRGPTDTQDDRFTAADRNRDGRITIGEWNDTRQAFRQADTNRDNVLSRDEYNAATAAVATTGTLPTSEQQFEALDANRNNRIEANEWRGSTSDFNRLDRDGNGWLSRAEAIGTRRVP